MVTKKKPVKVANPDCDVATKGYVKRIARKVWNHEHKYSIECIHSAIAVLCAWVASGFAAFTYYIPTEMDIQHHRILLLR